MKMGTEMLRTDRRRLRAMALTAQIMQIVGKYVERDRERDCMRELSCELQEALEKAGAEIVSDYVREAVGLPPRGPDGWTDEELVALEKRRLEMLLAPMPGFIGSSS